MNGKDIWGKGGRDKKNEGAVSGNLKGPRRNKDTAGL